MRPISRREFLSGAAAGGTVLALSAAGALAQSDKFDLVIKGGEVLDPAQRLRARRDIGIRNAVIAALEAEIPDARAKQTLDARGKLVLPGLIDMHAHVYPQVSAIGLPADELVPYTATTTYVSAGDAGANTFSALKHYIAAPASARACAARASCAISATRPASSPRCSSCCAPATSSPTPTRARATTRCATARS